MSRTRKSHILTRRYDLVRRGLFFTSLGLWFITFVLRTHLSLKRTKFNDLSCLSAAHGAVAPNMWVLMHSWDEPELLHFAMTSVLTQKSRQTTRYELSINLTVFVDRCGRRAHMDSHALCKQHACVIISGGSEFDCPSLGSAAAKWTLIRHLRKYAAPTDYFTFLDGDDSYASEYFFADIFHEVIIPRRPYFVWGKQSGSFSHQCKDMDNNSYALLQVGDAPLRSALWVFCHPRIFRTSLIDILKETHFRREDGSWLQKATDRPFVYAALETRPGQEVIFLNAVTPHVLYTESKKSGLKRFKPEDRHMDLVRVQNIKFKTTQTTTIHIVSAIFDRKNTRDFMTAILLSRIPLDFQIKVHFANNNPARQNFLEKLCASMSSQKFTFEVIDMKQNLGGMARYYTTKTLLKTEFMDFVIFIDDDQYVLPSTVHELWKQKRFRSIVSWFGKCWDSAIDAEYWMPKFGFLEIQSNSSVPKSWHYAGTGLAILDTMIFKDKRLFDIPKAYFFVEDLWLSYILHLNGWSTWRAFVEVRMDDKLSVRGSYPRLKETKTRMFRELIACEEPLPVHIPCATDH